MSQDDIHQKKMAKKKAIIDASIARATEERGILILLKGNGKGKSSSAFGTMARALGHGQQAGVVQFLKGKTETGEHKFFREQPLVDFHVMGDGFTWETQNKVQDIATAEAAWQQCALMLQDPRYNIVVFDEMSYMFQYDYLPIEPVIKALKNRPAHQNVIITGRTMHRDLQAIADTISEVQDIKHAFRQGVKAQAGIEW